MTIPNSQTPSLDAASETLLELQAFTDTNPAVTNDDEAQALNLYLSRARLAIKDADDERDKAVRPLNDQVKAVNAKYGAVTKPIDGLIKLMKDRLARYIQAVEAERARVAREAAERAAEAERVAREAERAEREAIEAANAGDLDANAGTATILADQAFADAQRAAREAERAERDIRVKVTGGFGRAVSMRTVEVLTITNIEAACRAMSGDDDLIEAIKTAARRYRKQWGDLPPGIKADTERTL